MDHRFALYHAIIHPPFTRHIVLQPEYVVDRAPKQPWRGHAFKCLSIMHRVSPDLLSSSIRMSAHMHCWLISNSVKDFHRNLSSWLSDHLTTLYLPEWQKCPKDLVSSGYSIQCNAWGGVDELVPCFPTDYDQCRVWVFSNRLSQNAHTLHSL